MSFTNERLGLGLSAPLTPPTCSSHDHHGWCNQLGSSAGRLARQLWCSSSCADLPPWHCRTLAPDTLTGTFPKVLLPSNPLPQVAPSAASPTLFFISVTPITAQAPSVPQSPLSDPVKSIATAGTAAPAGSSPSGPATAAEGHPSEDSDDCSSGSPGAQGEPFPDAPTDQDTPLSDLRLGRAKLLAEDTCGRTYRAQWRGVTCAVRVSAGAGRLVAQPTDCSLS